MSRWVAARLPLCLYSVCRPLVSTFTQPTCDSPTTPPSSTQTTPIYLALDRRRTPVRTHVPAS
eukprot:45581-Eustigmatos_ZCMA.PRE.1